MTKARFYVDLDNGKQRAVPDAPDDAAARAAYDLFDSLVGWDVRSLGGWAGKDEDEYVAIPHDVLACGPYENVVERAAHFAEYLRASWKAGHAAQLTIHRTAIAAALVKLGWSTTRAARVAAAAKWNRKAGCSCGCSPGFVDATGEVPGEVFITARFTVK